MARLSHSGQALAALLFIGMVASVSADSVRSPALFRRSLLTNPPAPAPTYSDVSMTPNRATDNPGTFSGLQDAASIGNSSVTVGHYINGAGLYASSTYTTGAGYGGAKTISPSTTGTWGQSFTTSTTSGADARPDTSESSAGISVDSVKLNLKKWVWMLDTSSGTAYKIDTSRSGSSVGTVNGVFQTSPSPLNQPVLVAVDSVGAAWVSNLNNVSYTSPSVVRILSTCTGTPGALVLGYSNNSVPTSGSWVGTTSPDTCVVQYTTISDVNATISAIAIDGGDNLWIVATNAYTGSASTNYLSIYKVAFGASTAILMYGPIVVPTGQYGSLGGNSAVVDQYGYLWTGSGTFLYTSGDSTTHSVIRFDTTGVSSAIFAVQVGDDTNQLNLNGAGDLFVAGGATVTKIFTNPATVTASSSAFSAMNGASNIVIGISSSVGVTLNLNTSALASACASNAQDGCCTAGSFDAGIAVSRGVVYNGVVAANRDAIYVANNCQTGLVQIINEATSGSIPTLGALVPVGNNIQAITSDRTSNVIVAASTVTDTSLTNVVYVVNGTTVTTMSGLVYASGFKTLGGMGDLSGYITAPTTATATFTYIHDTAITGYQKWINGTIGYSVDAIGSFSVSAMTSDNYTAITSASTPLVFTPTLDAVVSSTIGNGRYLRIDVQLNRNTTKSVPFIGPQGHGTAPTLSELRVKAYDHEPNALCASRYVNSTDDTTANGGPSNLQYSSATAGYCTQGAPLDIDNGSFDSDTQETDALIVNNTFTRYKSVNYIDVNGLPTYILETSYSPSTLTVFDYHGKQATCSATVAVYDNAPPAYIGAYLTAGSAPKLQVDSAAAPSLCVWPPNSKYYCKLNIFSQSGGRFIQTDILPVRDNCAAIPGFAMTVNATRTNNGALPTLTSGFSCTDSDPRSRLGDCVLVPDNGQYHICVKAQRRTVFTNLDRVYTFNFNVRDAGTQQGLNNGTLISRSLKVPPIWRYYTPTACPRAMYPSAGSTVGAGNATTGTR